MAPAFSRSSARSGRTNRNTGFDHDIVEGLPIRHWRRDNVTVAPPSHQDLGPQQNDKWAIELPHGMPKDSHLLPLHSQELLRAARSGRLYKRTAPVEDEEVEATEAVGEKVEKLEKKEKEIEVKGFTARTWKQVPKHLEGSEFEYLAARRKGLVNPAKATTGAGAQEPALTKATVKRTDAFGKVVVEDVVLKEGDYVLNGEILAQTVIPNPVVPETPAVVATPVRKKPPPPKRKAKGPGRGRRKKVQIVEGTNGAGAAAPTGEQNGTAPNKDVKTEPSRQVGSNGNEDTEMGGEGENQSDDEGDEEGDDDEDGDDETPNPTKNPSSQNSTPVIRTQTPILPPQTTRPSTIKQSLAPADPNATSVPSPLSQSSVPPPTLVGDSIMHEAPYPPAPAPPAVSQLPESMATSAEIVVAAQTHAPIEAQQEHVDMMLLDTDVSNIQEEQQPLQTATFATDNPQQAPEVPEETQSTLQTAQTTVESGDGSDDFIDYLGNLEKSLDQHDVGRSDINTQVETMEDAPAPIASAQIPVLEKSVLEFKSVLEDEKSALTPVPETAIEVPVIEEPSTQTQTGVIDEPEKTVEPAVEVTTAEAKEPEQSISEPIIEPNPTPVPSKLAEIKADLEADVVNTESEPENTVAAHEPVPDSEAIVGDQPKSVKESAPEQPAEKPAEFTSPIIESLPAAPIIEHGLPTKPAEAELLESGFGKPTESVEATEVMELLTDLPTEGEEGEPVAPDMVG